MNRLIVGSIVAVIISYIGIAIKRVYSLRATYLEDYLCFINELIEEVSFYKSPIIDFIDRVSPYKHREFRRTLSEYKEHIISNNNADIKSIYAKKKDIKIIQNCFNMLGRTDSDTQIFNLKNYKLECESMLAESRGELKREGYLASKLGILLGLALLILMI